MIYLRSTLPKKCTIFDFRRVIELLLRNLEPQSYLYEESLNGTAESDRLPSVPILWNLYYEELLNHGTIQHWTLDCNQVEPHHVKSEKQST